ncbi:lipocalin family protein [Dokdonia sp. Hel_I_53]|uniref:lipocalin family protein n=1 Tax=Dokdonia sp. Hel_I_53 TaxID=1566287 RepID=UPI00119A837E|nr:lipocalin family protein [Dokdonia sp. Hel_I_53]TVZ51699.1 lipocalin-like protein [Dokdonia sp. Hel_I_53]
MKSIKQLMLVAIVAVFVSCGSSDQVIKESEKTLKGLWSLTDISYDRDGIYDVKLFDNVTTECMVGSTWRFIPNNNFGNYELDPTSGCAEGKSYFIWDIPQNNGNAMNYDILLKPTDERMKSTMNNAGYRVNLAYLTDSSLTMTQTVTEGGEPFKITMNFTKTAE